jgi:hypothetical protein
VWEFKWDLLFHLIPLLQFDATTGTLLGVQHVAQHANWQLVLDLLKKAPTNMCVVLCTLCPSIARGTGTSH